MNALATALWTHPTARCFSYWWMRYRRLWVRTVLTSALAPTTYIVVMGAVLGSFVDRARAGGVDGLDYVAYVAPAMVAASAMMFAADDTSFPVFAALRSERSYEAQHAAPIGITDILDGHLAWVLLRVAVVSAFLVPVLAAVGAAGSIAVIGVVPVAVLTAAAFATWTAAFAASRQRDGALLALQRFVVTPMLLFGGVLYPVDQLPIALRLFAQATPLWHGASWSRDLAAGRAELATSGLHLAVLVAFAAAGHIMAVRTYRRQLAS